MGARIRQLNPDILTDAKVLALSQAERFFYVGTILQADDEGRLEWEPRQLNARILGGSADLTDVQQAMASLRKVGLLKVYPVGEREYACHPKWYTYQRINKAYPSRLPAPDGCDVAARTTAMRPTIFDETKRAVAVSYGCQPGENTSVTCPRCEMIGEIRWARRNDTGRPGSTVSLSGLRWCVTAETDVGSENDVVLVCDTCRTPIVKPAAVSVGPLFDELVEAPKPAYAAEKIPKNVGVRCPTVPKDLDLDLISISDSVSKSRGGVGEPKVDLAVAAAAAIPPPVVEKCKRVRPEEPSPPPLSADLETETVALIATIARHNHDGRISPGRMAGTRREIARRAAKLGEAAMLHGLREAVRYDKPSMEYAVACARSYKPGEQRGAGARASVSRGGGFVRTPENWTPRFALERRPVEDESVYFRAPDGYVPTLSGLVSTLGASA